MAILSLAACAAAAALPLLSAGYLRPPAGPGGGHLLFPPAPFPGTAAAAVFLALAAYVGAACVEAFLKREERPSLWDSADGTMFVVVMVAYAVSIAAEASGAKIGALVAWLFVLGPLIGMEERNNLRRRRIEADRRGKIALGSRSLRLYVLSVPVETALGWASWTTVSTAAAALIEISTEGLPFGDAIGCLAVGAGVTILAISLLFGRGSYAYAAVTAWFVAGIGVSRFGSSDPEAALVGASALGAAGLLAALIAGKAIADVSATLRRARIGY